MKKIFSKYQVWFKLSIISNLAKNIPWLLICYLLIISSLQKISMILKGNCDMYAYEMRFALLPESNKAKISSMPLLNLIF